MSVELYIPTSKTCVFFFSSMFDEFIFISLFCFKIHIFKNKGDIQNCTNYLGIKLISHTVGSS